MLPSRSSRSAMVSIFRGGASAVVMLSPFALSSRPHSSIRTDMRQAGCSACNLNDLFDHTRPAAMLAAALPRTIEDTRRKLVRVMGFRDEPGGGRGKWLALTAALLGWMFDG